ncbi:hypothetical protein A2363_02935 [Candidatus Gottesmanbacteria bacterium RIFOXYB1_FULL_47_11]|uniref:Uncharacterized protein n=1 Tax=Candidatus Gottesmanbacteria bacterium RIFOXYB1_FULL_47_11 TaxID=1798401 RepID=A0A1F6BCG4_9BACT|nr:MAG: hypothetical protein A2363_02935 [Candidatus Gottesmanbacteria bacterium RIFOXYB1_FULL_47_11]
MTSIGERLTQFGRRVLDTSRETERPAGPDMYIRNTPPFLTDLLEELRRSAGEKTPDVLSAAFSMSHEREFDRSYLITMMQRKSWYPGDPTGLGHLLIGRSHNPEETRTIFRQEERYIFNTLSRLPPVEYKKAIHVLHGANADWQTVLTLNRILQNTITRLRTQMNRGAMQTFYNSNQNALERLYADERRKRALATKHPEISPELLAASKPTIIYSEMNGKIYQEYLLPTMPKQNQEILQSLTDQRPPPIFLVLGKAGQPLVRAAAEATEGILKEQRDKLVEKYMRQSLERAAGEAVYRTWGIK